MPYLYHTDEDRRQMLDALGIESEEELFEQIPTAYRITEPLSIGKGRSEYETLQYFEALGARNAAAGRTISFLGGGIYDHIVPSIIKLGSPAIVKLSSPP